MNGLVVGGRAVGPGHPTYLVAELSANHGGSLDRALELVRLAAASGADAVKIQTYTAESMTIDAPTDDFVVRGGTLWDGRTLYELYEQAATPWEWLPRLQEEAADAGVDFFSSPFDAAAVALLDGLDVPVLKIASFELVDHTLVRAAAATGRPLIMSTGMATVEEIDEAVAAARGAGAAGLALLRCNSAYPAPPGEMDLCTIPDMVARWHVPVGLSDHTLGTTAAVAAVALGACIVEKHFTDDRRRPTADSAFSLEPAELRAMVDAVREAEQALGSVRYGPSEREAASLAFRRSLFVVADLEAGDVLTAGNVRSIRPASGLAPRHLDQVLGRRTTRPVRRGTPLSWDLVADH